MIDFVADRKRHEYEQSIGVGQKMGQLLCYGQSVPYPSPTTPKK
jgi:hypothetical protein